VALAARALAHPAEVPAELGDPVRALSALAIVAGTGVLAARIARAPVDVLALAVGGGASVGIAAATVAARRRRGRTSRGHAERLRGSSLLASVAPQSMAIVAADLDGSLHWLALGLWCVGLASYSVVAPLALAAGGARRGDRTSPATSGSSWALWRSRPWPPAGSTPRGQTPLSPARRSCSGSSRRSGCPSCWPSRRRPYAGGRCVAIAGSGLRLVPRAGHPSSGRDRRPGR